jgi:hypothetical protein
MNRSLWISCNTCFLHSEYSNNFRGVTPKNYVVGYDRMCIIKYNILTAFLDKTAFTALIA